MKYGMLSAVATAVMAASMPLSAATLNWTSAGDILTFDVHAQNENLNNAACAEVYEGLVRWTKDMKVEPALATSWKRVPEGFLFELRRGVKFHEGETLTADDVVFSYERALSPQSQFKNSTTGILGAEKKGDYTVLVKTVNGSAHPHQKLGGKTRCGDDAGIKKQKRSLDGASRQRYGPL